jgi:hypothetical protein
MAVGFFYTAAIQNQNLAPFLAAMLIPKMSA